MDGILHILKQNISELVKLLQSKYKIMPNVKACWLKTLNVGWRVILVRHLSAQVKDIGCLKKYDAMKFFIINYIPMPDKKGDLLIRFLT